MSVYFNDTADVYERNGGLVVYTTGYIYVSKDGVPERISDAKNYGKATMAAQSLYTMNNRPMKPENDLFLHGFITMNTMDNIIRHHDEFICYGPHKEDLIVELGIFDWLPTPISYNLFGCLKEGMVKTYEFPVKITPEITREYRPGILRMNLKACDHNAWFKPGNFEDAVAAQYERRNK